MKTNYPELANKSIDLKIYLKYAKRFLNDLVETLELKAEIEIDKIGIGAGPIVSLIGKTFALKIYSSSFGSSDKLTNCYLMLQPICPSMTAPYDLGHTVSYSLAYYANNPKYLIENLERVKSEDKLWKKIKPFLLSDKVKKNPTKYFDKIEEAYKNIGEHLNEIAELPHSRLESYWSIVKGAYLTAKQNLIKKKEIKIKDKGEYKNYDFLPYKFFEDFAKKRECKVSGKSTKYFYDKDLRKLFSQEAKDWPIKVVDMNLDKHRKYYSQLKKGDFTLHCKLFRKHFKLFLSTSRIYV